MHRLTALLLLGLAAHTRTGGGRLQVRQYAHRPGKEGRLEAALRRQVAGRLAEVQEAGHRRLDGQGRLHRPGEAGQRRLDDQRQVRQLRVRCRFQVRERQQFRHHLPLQRGRRHDLHHRPGDAGHDASAHRHQARQERRRLALRHVRADRQSLQGRQRVDHIQDRLQRQAHSSTTSTA